MYRLLGYSTQNTFKVLYVLEELGFKYEFKFIDLMKGEQKTEKFKKINPVGKTPVLQHDDSYIFESGAICRYLANVENSPLYPEDKMKRAHVDQWLDFFTCHLGRWLSELYYEHIIKNRAGRGAPDQVKCMEAEKFCHQQFEIINDVLAKSTYLAGDAISIADLCAFAYIEQTKSCAFDMSKYQNVKNWFEKIEKKDSIRKAKQVIS